MVGQFNGILEIYPRPTLVAMLTKNRNFNKTRMHGKTQRDGRPQGVFCTPSGGL